MSDQPGKPEEGDSASGESAMQEPEEGDSASGESASGESAMQEPELLNADDVRLAEPDVSADAVEPALETSPEEIRLSEPSLGAAEISEDAAEAASLDEAAAEAQSVAREAEEVGTLVGGPRPPEDPAEVVAPSGTAPAGGTAGDVADGSVDVADVPGDAADVPDVPADAAGATGATGAAADEPVNAADVPDVPADAAGAAADEPVNAADGPAEAPGTSVEEGDSAGLASFAASGDEPTWTGRDRDQSSWDALFDSEQRSAAADSSATTSAEAPDASDESPATPPEATAASTGTAAPEAPWAQPFATPHPHAPGSPVPPVGGPYGLPPAEPNDPAPTRIRARSAGSSSRGSNRKKLIILGVAGLVVLALLIFAIMTIINALQPDDSDAGSSPSTTPGADGIIAENISPLDLESGTCILGFDSTDVSADVTTVICTTPHNAQLLATTSFPEDAEFPGEAALNASGDDLCNSVPIDENAAAEYPNLTLTQVTPTSGTWADGDRRIDCFVVSDEGNIIMDTLLAE